MSLFPVLPETSGRLNDYGAGRPVNIDANDVRVLSEAIGFRATSLDFDHVLNGLAAGQIPYGMEEIAQKATELVATWYGDQTSMYETVESRGVLYAWNAVAFRIGAPPPGVTRSPTEIQNMRANLAAAMMIEFIRGVLNLQHTMKFSSMFGTRVHVHPGRINVDRVIQPELSVRAWGDVDLVLGALVNESRNMRAPTLYVPSGTAFGALFASRARSTFSVPMIPNTQISSIGNFRMFSSLTAERTPTRVHAVLAGSVDFRKTNLVNGLTLIVPPTVANSTTMRSIEAGLGTDSVRAADIVRSIRENIGHFVRIYLNNMDAPTIANAINAGLFTNEQFATYKEQAAVIGNLVETEPLDAITTNVLAYGFPGGIYAIVPFVLETHPIVMCDKMEIVTKIGEPATQTSADFTLTHGISGRMLVMTEHAPVVVANAIIARMFVESGTAPVFIPGNLYNPGAAVAGGSVREFHESIVAGGALINDQTRRVRARDFAAAVLTPAWASAANIGMPASEFVQPVGATNGYINRLAAELDVTAAVSVRHY